MRLPNQDAIPIELYKRSNAEDSNSGRNEHGPSTKRTVKQQARRAHRSCFVEETIVEVEWLYEESQRDV